MFTDPFELEEMDDVRLAEIEYFRGNEGYYSKRS